MSCHAKRDLPHLPSLRFESSRNHFGPPHVTCIFIFAASSASHTPILVRCRTTLFSMLPCLPFLVHEGRLVFWLWIKVFTIFPFRHQTLKTSCMLQCGTNFFSFLLDRHESSIHHRSFSCKLISFLIAIRDEPFHNTCAAVPSLCAAIFTCSTSTSCPSR